ncbi:MAG TPA: hypothetical protein IAC44_01750 [Candidatus Merdimorpha stercoravium]|uniref:Uncharacterized protein n=1 Tax=Candidatus Merdimorpha stercoravium TaxID=2840863 RepID=A0A9D1HAU1_9FLAO|nr:hypothetical protein [Candidatus Merdimorpha stercoravium]
MTEKQARTSLERLQKELDRSIASAKRRIDAAYLEALRGSVALWDLEPGSPEYTRLDTQLRQKYQEQLTEVIEAAEKEYERRCVELFAEAIDGLPSRQESMAEFTARFSGAQSFAADKQLSIARSGGMLSQEVKLLNQLLKDSQVLAALGTVRNGKLTKGQVETLRKFLHDPQTASRLGIDLHRWRQTVYGRDTAAGDAAAYAGNTAEQNLIKGSYVLQNTMGREVPEILGYRIAVRATNTRGGRRTRDICDDYAGDYSKDFVFTGWHYNCRCSCHPLIYVGFLTPQLKAKGFIGIPSKTPITRMPPGVAASLTKNLEAYRQQFPALPQANFVEYRGQTRLLAEMSPEEQLGYYLERFRGDDFLKDVQSIDVALVDPADPEVLMDTRITDRRARFQISTRTASDGHNPAEDLLAAFRQSHTGVELTKEQLSAVSDITHEMVHTMSQDESFARLEQLYPQWRNDILDFNLYPESRQRRTLEMLTEWYAREIFPEVAARQGWSLPADYRNWIGTGYTNLVDNLNTFLQYVPDPQQFRTRIEEILRRGDKALAYRFFTQTIRESGALRNARSATTALNRMLDTEDPSVFEQYMEKNGQAAVSATKQAAVVQTAGQKATSTLAAKQVEQDLARLARNTDAAAKALDTGVEVVKKDALVALSDEAFLRVFSRMRTPALFLAPFGMATAAYNEQLENAGLPAEPVEPGNLFPGLERYISPTFYRDRFYLRGLAAGVVDGAINLVVELYRTGKGVIQYIGYRAASRLSYLPIWPDSIQKKLDEADKKYYEINLSAYQSGSDLIEFIDRYHTDILFRSLFQDQVLELLGDYFSRMEGFSGEQGYAHGRFVFDVAIMLLPGGNLKKLLDSWKRTKSFKLLDFLPAQYKNLLKATPSQKDLRVIEKVSGEVDFTKPIPVDAQAVSYPVRSLTVSEDILRSGQQVSRPPVQGSVWDNVLQQIYESSDRPALPGVPVRLALPPAPKDVKSYLPKTYGPPSATEAASSAVGTFQPFAQLSSVKLISLPQKGEANKLQSTAQGLIVNSDLDSDKLQTAFNKDMAPVYEGPYSPAMVPESVRQQLKEAMGNSSTADKDTDEFLNYSASIPQRKVVTRQMELYKATKTEWDSPKDSHYWMTKEQLIEALKSGKLESKTSLPPGSRARQYYIYKITPKQEELKEGIPIFESEIAPIQDGIYRTEGGLLQIYVPNMDKWTKPQRVMRLEM